MTTTPALAELAIHMAALAICKGIIEQHIPASHRDAWFESEQELILNLMVIAFKRGGIDALEEVFQAKTGGVQ